MFPNSLQLIGVSLSLHIWQYHKNMISYKNLMLAMRKMREDEKKDK